MSENVGAIISQRRKELGLTMEQIADRIGVNKGTVSRWERGEIDNMRRDKIAKLAEVLHLSPLTLMGIKEETPAPDPEPTKDWLRQLCAGNDKALAALDRLSVTTNGEIKLAGSDARSEAVIQHQIKTLISALEQAADNGDGTKTAIWNPNK